MMGGMRDGDTMGRMGPMRGMMQSFGANHEGTMTPDELRTALGGRLSEHDADGNGTLSIDEFEAMHSAMIRSTWATASST